MKRFLGHCAGCLLAALVLAQCLDAHATTLLGPVEGRKQARELVDKLLSLQPTENSTNFGVLNIRDAKKKTTTIPVRFTIIVTETNWYNTYETVPTNAAQEYRKLIIAHDRTNFNRYELVVQMTNSIGSLRFGSPDKPLRDEMIIPFAGSDFSIGDLGLEFLHWPSQRIVKKEIKRSCGCSVLESLNPDPNAKAYSRLLVWIDNDSLGIVQAEAYDAKGELFKEFLPKSVTKVNGQWQVEEIEMNNVQTGSRTRIEFDLGQ